MNSMRKLASVRDKTGGEKTSIKREKKREKIAWSCWWNKS